MEDERAERRRPEVLVEEVRAPHDGQHEIDVGLLRLVRVLRLEGVCVPLESGWNFISTRSTVSGVRSPSLIAASRYASTARPNAHSSAGPMPCRCPQLSYVLLHSPFDLKRFFRFIFSAFGENRIYSSTILAQTWPSVVYFGRKSSLRGCRYDRSRN